MSLIDYESWCSEGYALLVGASKFLPIFIHFWLDLDKIWYRTYTQNILSINEFVKSGVAKAIF
jgi:hypothetical protein